MMHYRLKGKRGFTLVEIFVVIAILAILGTMGWQATKLVQSRRMYKTAEIQIGQMETGMNAYRQDYGDTLPYGDGDAWSAHVLYSALYCDEDNDGEPDRDKETKATKTPYCEAIVPVESLKKAAEIPNGLIAVKVNMKSSSGKKGKSGKKSGKFFAILDPWGKPYLYRLGYNMQDDSNRSGQGINPDFDIFSQGPDGLGDGLDNKGDNEDNVSNVLSWE